MRNRSGFTLIELSIVLVIIGLIVGGVLVGRDLIAAAKYRNAVKRITEFETAMNTFRVKYNCVAGDCAASAFFSGARDGNSNGVVERQDANSTTFVTTTTYINISNNNGVVFPEPLYAYDHLARAGLVNIKPYSSWDPTTFLPKTHWISILDKAIMLDAGSGYTSGDGLFIVNTDVGPLLNMGGHVQYSGATNIVINYNNMSPQDMFILDSKMDDGTPRGGAIWTQGLNLALGIKSAAGFAAANGRSQTQVGDDWIYTNTTTPMTDGVASTRTSCFFFKKPGF